MRSEAKGYISTFIAYFIWGALPLYWQILKMIPSFELLSIRILWSFLTLFTICMLFRRKAILLFLKDRVALLKSILAAALLCVNWIVFLVAVNHNMVVECSLGYYINPLVSVVFGMIFLKEKANKSKMFSLILASLGVLYLTINYGQFPFVSMALAFSFGLYGLLKKINGYDSLNTLLIEIMFMMPVTLIYLVYIIKNNSAVFVEVGWVTGLVLAISGIVTIVPLYMYAYGVNTIPLGSVGFIQFITPTMMFLIGVFINKEPFTQAHLISFFFIWLAVFNYCYSLIKDRRKIVHEI